MGIPFKEKGGRPLDHFGHKIQWLRFIHWLDAQRGIQSAFRWLTTTDVVQCQLATYCYLHGPNERW